MIKIRQESMTQYSKLLVVASRRQRAKASIVERQSAVSVSEWKHKEKKKMNSRQVNSKLVCSSKISLSKLYYLKANCIFYTFIFTSHRAKGNEPQLYI